MTKWTETDTYHYHIEPIHPMDAGGFQCAGFECQAPATHCVQSKKRDGMAIGLSAQWMCEAHMTKMRDVMDGKEG